MMLTTPRQDPEGRAATRDAVLKAITEGPAAATPVVTRAAQSRDARALLVGGYLSAVGKAAAPQPQPQPANGPYTAPKPQRPTFSDRYLSEPPRR